MSNRISEIVTSQVPLFIRESCGGLEDDGGVFCKFLKYYYEALEKTGSANDSLLGLLEYLDIDKVNTDIINGHTYLAESIDVDDTAIVVESIDKFLFDNGVIKIGDEVITYESTTNSPNISFSPGVTYEQVKLKWTTLVSPLNDFDGVRTTFPLISQESPIAPTTNFHLIVSVYNQILIPGIDFRVDGTNIIFTEAPRQRIPSDDDRTTSITFLNGFSEDSIIQLDSLSSQFGDGARGFKLTFGGEVYEPIVTEYVNIIYDNKLLVPNVDYFINNDELIFKTAPVSGRSINISAIQAPVPSFGSGAVGYARINDDGELTSISVNQTGSDYRFEYPPNISIQSTTGSYASAVALINGIKDPVLLDGGIGYSDTNPPIVNIESPTKPGSVSAQINATVVNGSITALTLVNSGSGYTFTPRISFTQPGGAHCPGLTISNGSVVGSVSEDSEYLVIPVSDGGNGYTTPPEVYVDEPTGVNGIPASLRTVIQDGVVIRIEILNAGQGYETTPRCKIIDPTGAQILDVNVDGTGRVIGIELLTGGTGYDDIPSVYIVDNRVNGGTGATAAASIFNGRITDINITNFGSGYSADNPPSIVIQSPRQAQAACSIGINEFTGFTVNEKGSGYTKAQFLGCARGSSGTVGFTEEGGAIFSNATTAASYNADDHIEIFCLDALFLKNLLDRYKSQFLPNIPELDFTRLNVRTAIKHIKSFYSSKGTSFSIEYLFKLLYGETVSISYPKEQIIKPSAATWSTDTILRATLVSGDPNNIKDGLMQQSADIADPNVRDASALIENYIAIRTSTDTVYELVLSEETIQGSFTVPYKTKLAEPLDTTTGVITVDSTIGWPERNGEFVIGGTEVVQYKEKSLNQFIECTRSVNGVVEDWDSATEVKSNFQITINKDTPQEVLMNVLGIVDAQQTTLTDTGSYYLPGDKLTVSKLGGTGEQKQLTTWLYNVKKLVEVVSVTFGGINDEFATVTCSNPHGLLVGDQVTVYGANPIIYNGTFLVSSRDSETVFQYRLPQPAVTVPQGNILISVDLNKGKSDNTAVNNLISPYTTNVQNAFFNDDYVYVASTGIPNYKIGPFPESALLPGNQRKLNRFPLNPTTISSKDEIVPGAIGTWVNGVSVWSYKSSQKKLYGAITGIDIINPGQNYDAASPPVITIEDGGGTGAVANVTVDGSISEISVTNGGSGYSSSPLVSIVGGGGSGASATAIITKGVVSRILINNGGSGYTTQPSITIVGGGGTGAEGEASVRGPIKSVNIISGGQSYSSLPTVNLSSGSGAVAQAIVNEGRIISIAIIDAGSGYTTAPEVFISGQGFGAQARATIDTDGENAGRVTSIEIVNKGIGYLQGTTSIELVSIGEFAEFKPKVFEWTYNLQQTSTTDTAFGSVFEGLNTQYGGEYAHISNPQRLRYILGDNLTELSDGTIQEDETSVDHSPIIGWAFDGNPIYGPYGYQDPTDQSSNIVKLNTSYKLKDNLVFNDITNPDPVRTAGPSLTSEPAGTFIEDYEYQFNLGDLDQYNGRFCKTPEFPSGRYCYFVTIDSSSAGLPLFPYVLGPSFNSVVDKWNLSTNAVQQNIPTGVIRFRDPYENVDIDVERNPNASTNALTLENGDLLLFEVEDENRDGIISQDEIDDPDQIFEEPPLQLYDYFPLVKFDSKVDIEVETTTKFKDASVTGFIVENPGKSYQVNDKLIFDNTDTDGSGVSARISKIKGEDISSYSFENISGESFGVLTTEEPHNLVTGDTVFVDYTPVMDNTNKSFVVRQYKGIEEIIINQTGSGYNDDIPPTIIIDGDGNSGKLQAIVNSVGAIDTVNILNSGSGYTKNPRVILSHPQVFKKADYFTTLVENNDYVKINDTFVSGNKETYICGVTKKSDDTEIAFVAKLSSTGVKEWEKTLESSDGLDYAEFNNIYVDDKDIWVTGETKPNGSVLNAYNPDIVVCKYIESNNGLDATLNFQRAYSGISGSTREDRITGIKKYTDSRFVISGYTNTNSPNPYDSFLALIDTQGNFAIKRKISSSNKSERILDILVKDNAIYFALEVANNDSTTDINLSIGKATIGTSAITVDWIKEYNNVTYAFTNPSIAIDEFDELYVCCSTYLKSNTSSKDSLLVIKTDLDGDILWQNRYVAPTGYSNLESCGSIVVDIFGDIKVAYNCTVDSDDNRKDTHVLELEYTGIVKGSYGTKLNSNILNGYEGWVAHSLETDISGDTFISGQLQKNRNEFILEFTGTDDISDSVAHFTPVGLGLDSTESLDITGDGVCKIYGRDVGTPANWENSAIKIPGTQLTTKLSGNWTLQFMLYNNSATTDTHSQTEQTLVAIGDATDSTGGLWLYYDRTGVGPSGQLSLVIANNSTTINASLTALQSTSSALFADNTWQFVSISKSGDQFTVHINGIQQIQGTTANTNFVNKDLYIGNIPGKNGTTGEFRSNEQGQYYVDNLRLKNASITPTVPSDVQTIPTNGAFGLSYDWTDDSWFTDFVEKYDYSTSNGFEIKYDRIPSDVTVGNSANTPLTNTEFKPVRYDIDLTAGIPIVLNVVGYPLGDAGLQSLDYDDVVETLTQNTDSLTYERDIRVSKTATIPSPGSQKLKVTAVVKDRYFFKVTDTIKIDNIQELTINQSFNFTESTNLVLRTGNTFVNSGYIVDIDTENNKIFTAVNNNSWTDDLNTGELSTSQFSELSTYGIQGPVPADVNEIRRYEFIEVENTTPGTFDIDLADYNHPDDIGTLDDFAKFKDFEVDEYSIRIDEISGSSSFIVGSVVSITSSDISFNSEYTTTQITNLTGVTKITLITNLIKVLKVTSVSNSDQVYVITATKHYLSSGEMLYIDGNPTQTVGDTNYDEYDGSFPVDSVISPLEFTYKLPQVAVSDPATSAGSVSVFVKSPTLKMYYGHQYLFDLSHSSLRGGNLSFSKDNLYKLEYSFNSIERIGTPGITGEGQPTPTVKLKVDRNIVTNISYYFDPSRPGEDSPVLVGSYLDVVDSPYGGQFNITSVSGGSITEGADIFKFKLNNEPEGDADIINASYSTSSVKAVGSIADIRIVNSGGFYTRLPIVDRIESTRQIERVQINDPGTEYAVGTYNGVPIGGDGEGGLVQITVADGTDSEGIVIPGQIQEVLVTSPGKGYTVATIDIESIPGILGSGLTGSGGDLTVVIPNRGSDASIFTKGTNVGKIKKLKNNNFGYDYPHDYTLRPEITFPINAQLTSTSILSSITVTDPGSGYSQEPAVVITGGGGEGAIAEAVIRNGRLDQIIVKDPGAGYSSEPDVELKSSFNYVVNLDLGLLQFAFPHGIANGAEVTLNVVDTGDGAEFPLSAGALGRLNGSTTYYAISGAANSLEDDQLKLAITEANAELGDSIGFVNAGTGRQQVLTSSFGGAATANVVTSTFLEGEEIYQGDTIENATATGFISTNNGWQIGPRIVKIVNYTGEFVIGQKITGVVSKSSGVISDLKIAKGVLEIGSITKTTGQFIDDVGKPSEIIQKIQDSYYYQDFSYAIKSSTSISEWKEILFKNVHPASFKVFGELSFNEYAYIPNKETFFQLTKSVELAQETVLPNIQNFALVEPIYSEFNNTEVLFRQKRLTSSENILTSVVQRLDDISNLFDGERIAFPLTVNEENVVANANQLMIILNGVVQNPGEAFSIQGDSIVFSEPPQPPASVKYAEIEIETIAISSFTFDNISGIFPSANNDLVGTESGARLKVTSVVGNAIEGYIVAGTFIIGELCTVGATGFSANLNAITPVVNNGLFIFGEQVTNFSGDTAKVESINLQSGQEVPLAKLRYTIGISTTNFEVIDSTSQTAAPVEEGVFVVGSDYQFGSEIFEVTNITNGPDSTTLTVIRAQNGTAAASQQESAPIYGTSISITDNLILSKTAGTYQSTPGLYNINIDDIIISAQSRVVARVVSANTYQDPVTEEFIPQVNISDGSSFFGLLFNRIASTTYPNVILDDISASTINVVRFDDNTTAFNSNFPANELINNYVITYDNETGDFEENEFIRNYKIQYGNNNGEFVDTEPARIRKITFTDKKGDGFFAIGQTIRTKDTKAEVIGYNQAFSTIYLGKIGRCKSTGEDYHAITFANSAKLDTAQKKYSISSLLLDNSTQDYVSAPSSSEFGFGTGAYTIELYIRPTTEGSTGTKTLIDFRDSTSDNAHGVLYLSAGQVRYDVGGVNIVNSGLVTLNNDTWYYIAVQRSSTATNGVTLIIEGAQAAQGTDATNYPAKGIRIGNDAAAATGFDGHIDEVRISNSSRYSTIPYTPQPGIFQGDGNAKLLLHFDGADDQTYTEDWSGGESLTNGEDFNNDAILATVNESGAFTGYAGKTHRYYDAADLIIANKEYLAQEVVYLLKKKFPYFTVPGGEVNCEDDIRDVLDELILDIRNGSNKYMWDASALYVNRTVNPVTLSHIETEIRETIWAYDKLKEILKYIINNELWSTKGDHGLTQFTDSTITDSTTSSFTQITPTTASYDPATGDMVVTASGHGLVGPTTLTPTAANYVPSTGIMTLTINNHGFVAGDKVQIAENGLTFTCAMDGYTAQKTYPRSNDPGALGWLEVSNITTNTFDVNVGESNLEYFIVTAATYDPSTGVAVLTIGDHTLRPGTSIKLLNESLTFTRASDSTEVSFPESGQSGYDTAINIINNGYSQTPTSVVYDPATGDTVITVNSHGLTVNDMIRIEDNSITFTCSQDDYNSNHTYPRSTDPASGRWLRISAVTTNTYTVNTGNAGTASNYAHTFVSADSDAITVRDQTITVNIGTDADTSAHTFVEDELIGGNGSVVAGGNYAHTFVSAVSDSITKKGDSITIANESIVFTCTSDGNNRQLAHPRTTDKPYQAVLDIKSHTTNTFTVDVNKSPEDAQFAHTFVSAEENAITVVDYNTLDCTDVYSTTSSLVEILTDTLREANDPTNTVDGDHLDTVTKVNPLYEFVGGTVDAFYEVPFTVDYHDGTDDFIYTNQIDADSRYRFFDAANLIRVNRGVIVDKAAADLISRYPDLARDMPRNENGGSTDGTLRCKTDLGLLLDSVADDVENGGNKDIVSAAKFYLDNNNRLIHIRLQIHQSLYAHERLGFYAKQAITGDLTYENTDNVIVGDWGITNDPGNCADVQSAIDTIISTLNDILAPSGSNYRTAADRLYFNRQFIAEECTGLTRNKFSYDLNGIPYSAFDYISNDTGEVARQNELKTILLSVISDLQTGGNNSTIESIEAFLDSNLRLTGIADEILAFTYTIEQLKTIGEYAINNRLYEFNSGFTDPDYAALFTDEQPYRDTESPSNINDVIYRFRELIDIAVEILAPGKDAARSAGEIILYNENYYEEEIDQLASTQFGEWVYSEFLETVINDTVHDLVTTDISDKSKAYFITWSNTDAQPDIEVGSALYIATNRYAIVYEYDKVSRTVIVGNIDGTVWSIGEEILSYDEPSFGATIQSIVEFDWYNTPTNVRTLVHARSISSNVSGELSSLNLYTNPEDFTTNWTTNLLTYANAVDGPEEGTFLTSDSFSTVTTNGEHYIQRGYNLTSFETFDNDTLTLDTTTTTFDEGPNTTNETQTLTFSVFLRATVTGERTRIEVRLDGGIQTIFFDLNLTSGAVGNLFIPFGGATAEYGAIPYGNGWYRAFITATFAFGFSSLDARIYIKDNSGALTHDNAADLSFYGAKLNKGPVDAFTSNLGDIFYSDREYNIKKYALDQMEEYIYEALQNTLTSPSPEAGFYSYYNSTAAADYNFYSIRRVVKYNIDIIRQQLLTGNYFTLIQTENGISLPSKQFGERDIPVGISGGANSSDYFYGLYSDSYGELESINVNEAEVVQVYKRFRIDGDITDGPFTMNETIYKQGSPTITGVVYGFYEDSNYKYLDVKITAGPWAVTDIIVGDENSTTAQISAIENRIHIIDLVGDFSEDIQFKGYTSGETALPISFIKNQASVIRNTGGVLNVDTESLLGTFDITSVVYAESSRQYIDVTRFAGFDLNVGNRVASGGNLRLTVSVSPGLSDFTEGNYVYKIVGGIQDLTTSAIITKLDLDNNYIYVAPVNGTLQSTDSIGDYGIGGSFPVGQATISTVTTIAGAGSAIIQDIKDAGLNKRLYLSNIVGTINEEDYIIGPSQYKGVVVDKEDVKARVKRASKGFDGIQTNFDLTIENGTEYLPDPQGHMLIFINGILQPPGASNAYTAFSNQIQFNEAPDLGASFTGFYVGKLRQLDDISFEFDSLRQSFNLKRNEVFYSLTLTDGVQSNTIRPENNIIVSLNGVVQEPGVGFEIVGSRIIFSEIPRVGSTFVAFSYVGSEADVDAAEIVPPVEPGDFIRIEGETTDREVAVIESSNSLITFDYLGSVFGRGALAETRLTTGFIDDVTVTAGGSGYSSRPLVRVESISGFDGQIRALVGVAGVEVNNTGSGYQNPNVVVETSVPDDWTAPNIEEYGEELIDPEIL